MVQNVSDGELSYSIDESDADDEDKDMGGAKLVLGGAKLGKGGAKWAPSISLAKAQKTGKRKSLHIKGEQDFVCSVWTLNA